MKEHYDSKISKSERIKKNQEFNDVFNGGKVKSRKGYFIVCIKNKYDFSRLGIVISGRKRGTAVKRNKEKRYIREIYRNNKHLVKSGYDIVIGYKMSYTYYSYENREHDLIKLFQLIP